MCPSPSDRRSSLQFLRRLLTRITHRAAHKFDRTPIKHQTKNSLIVARLRRFVISGWSLRTQGGSRECTDLYVFREEAFSVVWRPTRTALFKLHRQLHPPNDLRVLQGRGLRHLARQANPARAWWEHGHRRRLLTPTGLPAAAACAWIDGRRPRRPRPEPSVGRGVEAAGGWRRVPPPALWRLPEAADGAVVGLAHALPAAAAAPAPANAGEPGAACCAVGHDATRDFVDLGGRGLPAMIAGSPAPDAAAVEHVPRRVPGAEEAAQRHCLP